MAPSLYQGDGSFNIPGHDDRVYLVQEVASLLAYAPYRSYFAVQSVSAPASCTEERSYSGGSIPHLRGLLVQPCQAHHVLLVPFLGQGPLQESDPELSLPPSCSGDSYARY